MSTRNRETSLLATLVGFDLLWRFPARLLAHIPEWVAPLFSIGSGVSGNTLLATASTWLLFAVTFFVLADRIYPDSLELPFDDDRFRLLIVGIGLTSGISLGVFGRVITLMIVFLGVEFIGAGVLVGYLNYTQDWQLFDPDGRIVGPMELSNDDAGDRFRHHLQSNSIADTINAGFFVMANAMLLAAPCLLLGLLAQTSIYAFPLPDLIILGYLFSVVLGKTDTFDRVSPPVDPTQIDIEERLHRGLRTVLHSDYGLFLTVYCLLGAFLGCGTLGIAVSVGWAYLGDIINAGLTFDTWVQWLYLWHLIGVVLLLVLAGGYGIWVWLREFKRLPSYIRYYAEGSEGSLRVSPPRPVGMTLVPVGVLLLAGAWLEFLSVRAFAVLWPLTAIGVVGCVYLTLRRESTSINNENHIIIAAFLIHGLGILAIGKSSAVFRIITHNQLPLREIFHSPLPMIVVVLVVFPYFEAVSAYARQFQDLRKHLTAVYLTIFGTAVWVVSRESGNLFETAGWMIAVISISFGVFGAIIDEFSEDFEGE